MHQLTARFALPKAPVFILLACLLSFDSAFAQKLPEHIVYKNNNPFALIAGGSKGIGYAIAEALAGRHFNLILIARNEGSLRDARDSLVTKYGVQVEIWKADLTDEQVAPELGEWCKKNRLPLKMLCNVAGMGGRNDFLKLPADSLRYMIKVNLESPVVMVSHLLPVLEKNKPSYILNVASMAAFGPIPVKNVYSASKSGLLFFSYSLRNQLKDRGVSVSCLAPGPVYTKPEIKQVTKESLGFFGDLMAVAPRKVGEIAVEKTLDGKMLIVPGTMAKLSSVMIRILPRRWAAGIYGALGD